MRRQPTRPSGAVTDVKLPHITGGATRESSHTQRAEVTLPPGMGINPSAGNGLVACSDEQFGKGTKNPVACPPASKVGTVTIETPPLPEGSLTGDVYVGQPKSTDPASGDLYRLFVVAGSDRYGISARLIGNVKADPQTGRLTTVFDDAKLGRAALPGLPQVPFTSFKLDFNDGPRAPLTSPQTCGPHTTTTSLTPWTGNPPATPSGDFKLDRRPGRRRLRRDDGGAPVRTRLQSRDRQSQRRRLQPVPAPHHPRPGRAGAERRDGRPAAGPDREAGQPQVLPGVGARRRRGQLAASNEAAVSSCPNTSFVGTATVHTGSGEPLRIGGKAFLAGPYAGAPLSLAVITPATAGPFDLGAVVLRVALMVDHETAQVHAISDPIPHVFGGALLDISSVDVDLDRKNFSLNGTNCSPMAVGATLRGGGANPADAAGFTAFPGLGPVPAERVRGPRVQAEALAADVRRDEAGEEPEAEGGPQRPRRRRQPQPRRGHPAEGPDPRPEQHRESLHPDPVRGERLPGQLPLRLRPRLHAAARQAARRPGPPALLRQHPARPRRLAARPDRHRRRRQDRHRQGPDPELVQRDPRRAGLEIRTHRQRRQAGNPDQQPQPLPEEGKKPKKLKAVVRLFAQNGKKAGNKKLRVKTPCGKKKKRK